MVLARPDTRQATEQAGSDKVAELGVAPVSGDVARADGGFRGTSEVQDCSCRRRNQPRPRDE